VTELRLCALADLADPGSRGFSIAPQGREPLELFVVRRGTAVFAYRNRCPHTGAPLEWQPDQFLDYEGSFIQCALHGALFDMADGRCLRGPCVGDRLTALVVRVRDGAVMLVLDG
jgi:nitrite reductase/ring-hydroxylating ferredoxin subunit